MRKIISIAILCMASFAALASPKYIVLIDAGSSGSRLNIYQVEGTSEVGVPLIQQAPYPLTQGTVWSKKITPGLDSFASHPQDIEAYITPLLNFASEKLSSVHASANDVAFHIYGTAGMRLLPEAKQKRIYNKLMNIVNNNFSYHMLPAAPHNVKTISGKEEAVYDWLSVNYLDNQLAGSETVGVMDMGGASTQIAFATDNAPNANDLADVHIGSRSFRIYAKSYLGLGQDQARINYSTAECYPKDYSFKKNQEGHGNYEVCENSISHVLNQDAYPVRRDTPSLPNKTFYAVAGYYFTNHFFNANNTLWDTNAIKKRGSNFCQTSWSDLRSQYPDEAYLGNYCFNAAYFNTLLTQGFGFANTAANIKTVKMIQNKEISWTLGAAMRIYDAYYANGRL